MFELSELKKIRNPIISDSFIKAQSLYTQFRNIAVSVSGGGDSDIVVDIMSKIDTEHRIKYVWFNTGIEYQATIEHLTYLESRYNIQIERVRALKPIPISCKIYGQPFISKMVSSNIELLQRHGFLFEDKPYEELIQEYTGCDSGIKWWCNRYDYLGDNIGSTMHNIAHNKWLKEFLILNPPLYFNVSAKCCKYAKKDVSKQYIKDNNIDLMIIGIRKAEGGVRSRAYQNCFTPSENSLAKYRPIFWYDDKTKKQYENYFDIVHSLCYTKYGFKRTGCVGCPFNRELETDLQAVEKYEPKLKKAVEHVFTDTYEFTREYREFARKMNEKERNHSYKLI